MTAFGESPPPPPRPPGRVSKIYEVIGIDDGGDPHVRRSVRRVLAQVVRFVAHYAEALKSERRSQRDGAPPPADKTPTQKE